jgi:hypothetical protein
MKSCIAIILSCLYFTPVFVINLDDVDTWLADFFNDQPQSTTNSPPNLSAIEPVNEPISDFFNKQEKHKLAIKLPKSKTPIMNALLFAALNGQGAKFVNNKEDGRIIIFDSKELHKFINEVAAKNITARISSDRIKSFKVHFNVSTLRTGKIYDLSIKKGKESLYKQSLNLAIKLTTQPMPL